MYASGMVEEFPEASMRNAWREYIHGYVPPHAFRQIRNFMLASTSEGRNCEDLEEGYKRGKAVRCRLSQDDVERALQLQQERAVSSNAQENPDVDPKVTQRVLQSANLAVQLSTLIQINPCQAVTPASNITKLQWTATDHASAAQKNAADAVHAQPSATCTATILNWQQRYTKWRADVFEDPTSLTPNAEQRRLLDLVHERRLVEFLVENDEAVPENSTCRDPLLRLIHGLPGSGKTQILLWLRSYFEEVWSWTLGTQFIFLAPLNSMASNIQGATVHSWGRVPFKDRRGLTINTTGHSASEEVPHMTVQCNAARFLFIDEIEATGADTLGAMEEKILHHTSLKAPWRYKDENFPRLFGGMNVCFFGDFWQLTPTGQISIMSDVTATKVLENA